MCSTPSGRLANPEADRTYRARVPKRHHPRSRRTQRESPHRPPRQRRWTLATASKIVLSSSVSRCVRASSLAKMFSRISESDSVFT